MLQLNTSVRSRLRSLQWLGRGKTGVAKSNDPSTFDISHLEPQVAQLSKGGLGSITTTRDPDCHRRSAWPRPTGRGRLLLDFGQERPEQGFCILVKCSDTAGGRVLDVLRRGQPLPLESWALGLFSNFDSASCRSCPGAYGAATSHIALPPGGQTTDICPAVLPCINKASDWPWAPEFKIRQGEPESVS